MTAPTSPRSNCRALIVGSVDDVASGWERCRNLRDALTATGLSVHLVNKRGFVLDDLRLVARHRVVATPTVLVFRGDEPKPMTLMRHIGLPSAREVVEFIRDVEGVKSDA